MGAERASRKRKWEDDPTPRARIAGTMADTSPANSSRFDPTRSADGRHVIDLTDEPDSPPPKKTMTMPPQPRPTQRATEAPSSSKKSQSKHAPEEKRLRRFRPNAPQSFHDIYHRATTQRFFVLSRARCGTAYCPEEMLELAGTTGNVYTVVIARQPLCDCPHAAAGNQCKHVVYTLSRVLRARYDLVYQLALTSEELREIFDNAPLPPSEDAEDEKSSRKPVDGDCPICFSELQGSGELVWCRAACGQNMHKSCFEMWASTKRQQGAASGSRSEVTCPFCRSVWEGDADLVKKIEMTGKVNRDGYVNVADQLGISDVRDTSTYSSWWPGHGRRRRHYSGYDNYDGDLDDL